MKLLFAIFLVCDGQSILLPLTADIDTVCEKMTAKIEILHLGWIIYSITV
jgi:hypothetical protein